MAHHSPFALLLVLSLFSCAPNRHAHMQEELAALQVANQADSLLTDDSLAQALTDWFDSHGTPNEQMEAHYLLGRTHADRGEAPAALASYHDAIDRADTTAADCNYRQLYKVYAQMADIFYDQNLMTDYLNHIDKSAHFAMKGGDTISALNLQAYKILAYGRNNEPDSVLIIYEKVRKDLCEAGYTQNAASFSVIAIENYLKRGLTEEARECIDFYESESGFFDEKGNIEKGREAYYYVRGMYHLAVQEYDSAYYFFRKELNEGLDYDNQNSASRGLANYFQLTGEPDSAAIYALYSYDMMDSVYAQKTTSEVERMHQMHSYARYQEKALVAEKHAKAEEAKSLSLIFIIIVIACVFFLILLGIYRKRRKERIQYIEAEERLKKLVEELSTLEKQKESFNLLKETIEKNVILAEQWKEQEEELKCLIAAKENETERLKNKIVLLKSKLSPLRIKDVYAATRIYEDNELFRKFEGRMEKISDSEWETILQLVKSERPELFHFISINTKSLGVNGSRICILLSQPIRVKEAAIMMGVQPSYISKVSTEILEHFWKTSGSSKELKRILATL